ncbi:MAG: hypothetical protein R3B06_15430 [Kofleriaceae bacterium]
MLIALAVVLSLMGVLSHDWFGARDAQSSVAVGLRDVIGCQSGECTTLSLRNLEAKSAVTMSGNVAYFAALLGSVLGLLAGGLALAGKPVVGPISPARLAAAFFGASAVGGLVFIVAHPGPPGVLSMGTAGPMAIGGGVFGVIGSVMLAIQRPERPSGPVALPAATVAPVDTAARPTMAPACPQCAAPTELNPQHQRWYCAGCRAYV